MSDNVGSRFRLIRQSPIPYRATLLLVALAYVTSAVSCHRNDVEGREICDAAGKGDLAAVEALLRGNSKLVFSKDGKGNTPLHLSASHGHRDVTELLLASKADVNARTDKGNTPLQWAAYNGHRDVAALLLANGANVNAKDNRGWTPLHCAAYQGKRDVAELLLANHADVNALADRTVVNADPSLALYRVAGGWTPYDMAAAKGHRDVAELLRQHGGHE